MGERHIIIWKKNTDEKIFLDTNVVIDLLDKREKEEWILLLTEK